MDPGVWLALTLRNRWLEDPTQAEAEIRARIPAPFVPRRPARGAEGGPSRAVLVVGPRQAGKSSFLWEAVSRRHARCLSVVGEDPALAAWCASPAEVARDLLALRPAPEALLLDEAQHVENAGLLVKTMVDLPLGMPIYVTGSSSWHLGDRVRESLAGRATRVHLYPFSLEELLRHRLPDPAHPAVEAVAREILERQLLFGGFPDVFLRDREAQRLFDLVEAFVLRDASDRFRIRKPAEFRRLAQRLATQVGNLVNLSEHAAPLGVSVSTVTEWIGILEDAHVVRLLPVFAGGKRVELSAARKVFFIDNGVRNVLLRDFSSPAARADRGALFENLVFSELLKRLVEPEDLRFWRTQAGAEVDFVLHRPGLPPIGIEAKLDGQAPRISRGARSFLSAYEPELFLTVTLGEPDETRVGPTRCLWCRPWELGALLPETWTRMS